MQPPARGSSQRPSARGVVVQDKHRQDWVPGLDRCVQGGLVRKAKVIAKPQDHRRGVFCPHEWDLRRWQSSPHLGASLEYLNAIFDHFDKHDIRIFRK